MTHGYAYSREDIYVSEKDKNDFAYLSASADYFISTLVADKTHITLARNLYEGVRDPQEFKYLQDTFGMETAVAVKMTPLVKTRIDALIGLLADDLEYYLTVNDYYTLDQINEQRRTVALKEMEKRFKSYLQRAAKEEQPSAETYNYLRPDAIQMVLEDINKKFVSTFEKAGATLLYYFKSDPTIDIKKKLREFFKDLLLTGEAYYRVNLPRFGSDPVLEIKKPENIFYNKNTNHSTFSTGTQPHVYAVVNREFLTRTEILNRYGHLLNDEQRKEVFGVLGGAGQRIIRSARDLEIAAERRGIETTNQFSNNLMDVLPVYHVEWLANNEIDLTEEDRENLTITEKATNKYYKDLLPHQTDKDILQPRKVGYRLDRYEITRISDFIYVEGGKSTTTPRWGSVPGSTILSYNGAVYNDRNGQPYSMALKLKDLQDSYDIVTFYRDNLIANSGTNGSRINAAAIPKVLGNNFMERLLKFLALRKQGVELIDPTEEGAQLFSHYGDFRAALDAGSVEAIQVVLESIERQADIATGVNRYMYQAAEQRDAVQNVKTGITQVGVVVKEYFDLAYESQRNMLWNLLFTAQKSYVKGKRGSYLLGHQTKVFDIAGDDISFFDLGLHLENSDKEKLRRDRVEALLPMLVEHGKVPPELLLRLTLARSTSDVLDIVDNSMTEYSKTMDQLGQLQGELDQTKQALQKAEAEVRRLESQMIANKDKELSLKGKIAKQDHELDERLVKVKESLAELEKDKIRIDAEKAKMLVQLENKQLAMEAKNNAKEPNNKNF